MLSLLTKSHRITSLARCQFNSSSALKTPSRSMSESSCIFCKIVNKTAEANILHEVNTGGLETVWQCDSVTGLFRTRGCLCSQTEAQVLSTTNHYLVITKVVIMSSDIPHHVVMAGTYRGHQGSQPGGYSFSEGDGGSWPGCPPCLWWWRVQCPHRLPPAGRLFL